MRLLLLIVVGVISLYHIMLTGMAVQRPEMRVYLPLIRDALRVVAVICISIAARARVGFRRIVRPLLQDVRPLMISVVWFLVWGIGITYLTWGTRQQMLIGVKYDIRFFLLGLLAVVGWWRLSIIYTTSTKKSLEQDSLNGSPLLLIEKYTAYIWRWLVGIIAVGFLWQIAKVQYPDLFMKFGYGPVGDYAYGEHPPIRYRTWPGGTMRRSGIFAGPNNYGYFLVAFFGFFLVTAKRAVELLKKRYTTKQRTILLWCMVVLYAAAVLLSFSRGALIGCLVQLGILWRQARKYVATYMRTTTVAPAMVKRRTRRWGRVITTMIVLVGSVVWRMSVLKWWSTMEHFQRSREGIELVVAQPRWYGLGSSGPAVHRGGKYLPENMYIQVLLDTGWIWFALWIVALGWRIVRGIRLAHLYKSWTMWWLRAGLIGLSIEGVFLHVWEDSMVNMLFLGLMGVLIGVLLQQRERSNRQ